MKRIFTLLLLFFFYTLKAQKQDYISISITNNATAYPFAKFIGFVTEPVHPGVEAGLSRTIKVKKKHDWFREFRLGYFYHRFVQHGIPLYANIGYRYKFSSRFSAEAALGGGYLHSIPATAKLKLNSSGEYKNNKGIGRAQGIAGLGISTGYILTPSSKKPLKLFVTYQQRLQMPFVKSYVTFLPYNCFMIGISQPIQLKK